MTREEAINAIKEHIDTYPIIVEIEALEMAIKALEHESKTGNWIERIERDEYNDYEEKWFECDQCHIDAERPYNYCPNCGARMDGEE